MPDPRSASSRPDLPRLFRGIPGLFLVLEPGGAFTILAASEDYLRVTHTDASIIGRPLFEAFPANPALVDAAGPRKLLESLHRVLATRQPDAMAIERYDVRLPPAQGGRFEERYWSPINAPVLTADGAVDFIVHRVEEASAKANHSAIAILESITEGFFTLDRQWRFDYVNREAHRILGVPAGHLAGKVVWTAYPGLEGTEFERSYHRTMYRREKSSFTAFYALQERWYEVTCFPAPEGVSVYFRDVSAQKRLQAERELLVAESERQRRIFEVALDSTPDFVYVFDTEHRAIYANAALLKIWGVDDVRGKRWIELGYEQWHADLHDQELDRVITTRAPIRGEVPFTGTNGRRVYDYIFAPVLNADGQVVAVAGTTRDVTERKAAERVLREQSKRLAQADQAKDEFLATLSHELRNPLAPLRNAIELMRRMDPRDEGFARIHSMMERQVAHLIRLVDDLLEVSRISRGTFSLRKARVALDMAVRNALEASEPLVQAGGHVLNLEMPPAPLHVDGDLVRLTQVLANLLNNAATYNDHAGRIDVRAWQDGDQACVSVRDDGIGIAAEALPRLFEMFSRGQRERAHNQGGLGIGLALARRLAQMHGGTLEAHSAGLGHGSTFILRLPRALEDRPEAERVEAPLPQTRLEQLRVLVVDDNRDAADSLAAVLRALGAEVGLAYSGPEGLRSFAAMRPAVVLLDIGMPGMDGCEVARAIRQNFPEQAPTLVALTGWGQDDDRERTRAAGFDHHLVKPAELPALKQLLSTLMG